MFQQKSAQKAVKASPMPWRHKQSSSAFQRKKPKVRSQNPTNLWAPGHKTPTIPGYPEINPQQTLYKDCLLLSSLLCLTRAEAALVSSPINILCEGCCMVWFYGIPWLLTNRIPFLSKLYHLHWQYSTPQSSNTSIGDSFPFRDLTLTNTLCSVPFK